MIRVTSSGANHRLDWEKTVIKTSPAMEVKDQLKIAISIWTFTPNTGGLQSHAENLCKHLLRRGHSVVVVTRSATKVPIFDDYLFFNEPNEAIQVDGIPIRALRFSHTWSPVLCGILKTAARPKLRWLASRLYERVSERPAREAFAGVHLIHHVGHATALVGLAGAKAAEYHKIPFLVQPTAHPGHFGDSDLDMRLYHQADRLLLHTCYERDYFNAKGIRCPKDVVYNGIEDRVDGQEARFRAKHNVKGPIILFLGRKSEDKGYPLVIDAFKRIQQKHPNTTLVCIGPKDFNHQTEDGGRILELDFVSEEEKHDALAACTFLCVPSLGESFGLVYMEAGRYAKPSIGRNVPVLRELLGRENAALLMGTPDDQRNLAILGPEELAAGMDQLLGSPSLCREIGENCRKVSESFVWPKVIQHFESAYLSALEKTKAIKQVH